MSWHSFLRGCSEVVGSLVASTAVHDEPPNYRIAQEPDMKYSPTTASYRGMFVLGGERGRGLL